VLSAADAVAKGINLVSSSANCPAMDKLDSPLGLIGGPRVPKRPPFTISLAYIMDEAMAGSRPCELPAQGAITARWGGKDALG